MKPFNKVMYIAGGMFGTTALIILYAGFAKIFGATFEMDGPLATVLFMCFAVLSAACLACAEEEANQ